MTAREITAADLYTADGLTTILSPVSTDNATPLDIVLENALAHRVFVNITTDGSGLEQVINIPAPGDPKAYVGQVYIFQITTLGDPGDTVKITNDGDARAYVYPYNPFEDRLTNITLTDDEGSVAFIWQFDEWAVDPWLTDFAFNADRYQVHIYVEAPGAGGNITFVPKSSAGGSDADAGRFNIEMGVGDGAGLDGQVVIRKSSDFSAGLPTADPGIAGALFTVGATSAGVPKAVMESGG